MVEVSEAPLRISTTDGSNGSDLSRFVTSSVIDEIRFGTGRNTEPSELNFGTAESIYGNEDGTTGLFAQKRNAETSETKMAQEAEEEPFCEDYESHDGLFDLLDLTVPSFNNALNALPSELSTNEAFTDKMRSLPELLYSGRSEEANRVKTELLQDAGEEGREALEDYFKSIDQIASDNHELVEELSNIYKTCPAVQGEEIPIG